ncbi:MAG: hypothetical protein JWN04_103 [Myxococcaceae bacterium]|nr:hypothetical protein [Myxococcaceae bacterium]
MLIAGFVGSAYFWTKGAFEHGTARELFNGFVLGSEFMMIGNAVESRRQSAKKA